MEKCYREQGGEDYHADNKSRKANWIGHILSSNCHLKHVIEGKLKGTRRGGSRKQLLVDLKEKRGYWKLKDETLELSLSRTCFGRSYGSIVR